MAQSGKDAILAAARRIAELDSDDDDIADDGDWANWGGIDWKNLDVDDEAEFSQTWYRPPFLATKLPFFLPLGGTSHP